MKSTFNVSVFKKNLHSPESEAPEKKKTMHTCKIKPICTNYCFRQWSKVMKLRKQKSMFYSKSLYAFGTKFFL